GANFSGFAFPQDCGLVLLPGLNLAVETVVGEIDLAVEEPLSPGQVPFQDFVPFLEPVQLAGNVGPELFRIGRRSIVELLVLGHALYPSMLAELHRRVELAGFAKDGLDILLLSDPGLWHESPV